MTSAYQCCQDASFDVVTCQYGLFFMPEHERALREAARVLRPGGLLTASVFGKEQQMAQVRDCGHHIPP